MENNRPPNGPLFEVGQPVVALKSEWITAEEKALLGYPATPRKGLVYHVREIYQLEGVWYLYLRELPSDEIGYEHQYFAPLDEGHDDDVIAALMEEVEENALATAY